MGVSASKWRLCHVYEFVTEASGRQADVAYIPLGDHRGWRAGINIRVAGDDGIPVVEFRLSDLHVVFRTWLPRHRVVATSR
jgi:hypothetical protein